MIVGSNIAQQIMILNVFDLVKQQNSRKTKTIIKAPRVSAPWNKPTHYSSGAYSRHYSNETKYYLTEINGEDIAQMNDYMLLLYH